LIITVFVSVVIIVSYLRTKRSEDKDVKFGVTTEMAALVTFVLGYIANRDPLMTLIIGVVVLVVLLSRRPLHAFSRQYLRPEEMKAIAILLVIALGVLPFLPKHAIDPWNLFYPQRFGILVLLILSMQFAGYAAMRIFGTKRGALLSGFCTGLVSSTIATLSISDQVRKKALPINAGSAAITLATVAMLLQLLVIIGIASPALFPFVFLPLIATAIVGLTISLVAGNKDTTKDHIPLPDNPLALWAASKQALILALMLIFLSAAKNFMTTGGTEIVATIGGLVQTHGVSMAIASLHHTQQLTLSQAIVALGLAIIASFVTKFAIIFTNNRGRFVVITSGLLALMLLATIVVWGLVIFNI